MELMPLNSKVVAETITRILRSIGDRLVCFKVGLWVEEAQIYSVRSEITKQEMAPP